MPAIEPPAAHRSFCFSRRVRTGAALSSWIVTAAQRPARKGSRRSARSGSARTTAMIGRQNQGR